MSTSVVSKNAFESLGTDSFGNDVEDKEPKPLPSIPGVKSSHGTRRTGPQERQQASAPESTTVNTQERIPQRGDRGGRGQRGRGRGGRGDPRSFHSNNTDRQNKSGHNRGTTEKQAGQSWGTNEGKAEEEDEKAADETVAAEKAADAKEDTEAAADAEPASPAEPEDKSISFEDYQAQLAEKRGALEDHDIRTVEAPTGATQLANSEEDFVPATSAKKHRTREAKNKTFVDVDLTTYVPPPSENRGGRGGARGGPRGGYRGDRGDREGRGDRGDRPERAERGDREGGRGRGRGRGRGGFQPRGDGERREQNNNSGNNRDENRQFKPRGGNKSTIDINDEKNFPSLG